MGPLRHTNRLALCPMTSPDLRALTYELHRLVQPGQDLFTEAVVDGHAQEVCVGDEVGLGTRVAGVQHEDDVVLLHQVLHDDSNTFNNELLVNHIH